MMKNLDLQDIRRQIDEVDGQLAELIEQRMQLAADVAEYKLANGKAVYDPAREREKLSAIRAMAKTPFGEIALGELLSQMMTISRRYQYQVLGRSGMKADAGFRLVENLSLIHI